MDLVSLCALRTGHLVWRYGHGGFAFTVVCKATFELSPDVSPLAAAQEPVTPADVYRGDTGSLAVATDLVPFKMRPELLVLGHAHAPDQRPVTSLAARVALGEIHKAIQVTGDRYFDLDDELCKPAPFTRMPLVWERAAGGPDTSNPAGVRTGARAKAGFHGHVVAPNLLPATQVLASRSDVVAPVGLGPIAPHWPSRAACLREHAATWDPARWHERPLPADFDAAYFNAAPSDQQRAQPFGDETLYLENLHPRFPRLSTRLSPIAPSVMIGRGTGAQPLPLRCDTLIIDTDRGLAMLVWRAHVLLDRPDQTGHVVVTATGSGGGRASAPARSWAAQDATLATVTSGLVPASAPLPFSSSAAPGPSPERSDPAVQRVAAVLERIQASAPHRSWEGADATIAAGLVPASAPLPFAPPRADDDDEEPPTPRRQLVSQPDATAEPPWASNAPLSPPASVLGYAPGAHAAPLAVTPAPYSPPVQSPTPPVEYAPPPTPQDEAPPPPALLGPLATVSAEESGERDTERPPPAAPPEEPEPEVAFDRYPPERCGAIAALLAYGEAAAPEILRAEDLDATRWERVHEHWQERIREEAARGRKKALGDYDSAYVSALEARRGSLALTDYARLAEAAERSAVEEALTELGLPRGAWPHIHRVWITRMVKDIRVGKQVRAAIDSARAER